MREETMTSLTAPLIRKLESLGPLRPEERESIQAMPLAGRQLAAGEEIAWEGDEPTHCCLAVEGFLKRYSTLSNGIRQTLSLHISGDIPDLQGLHLKTMDHTLASVGPSQVALIAHSDMNEVLRKAPRLAALFWRDSLIDAAVSRAWVKMLGGHDAFGKFAHLMCELYVRMDVVGLAKDKSCPLPLSQAQLGEALGTSVVHINRTMRKLRAEKLVDHKNGRLFILDWDRLSEVADFDPAYLNLRDPPR
jgi:CRP-like cAMP-binding protein